MPDTLRLAKYIMNEHNCSRRQADNYILGGWVRVDGAVIEEPGFRVTTQQKVTLDPDASSEDIQPVTVLLHKPAGWGASDDDGSAAELLLPENQHQNGHADLSPLRKHFTGLILATPLDKAASGLIVATQEYRVSRKLLNDAAHVEMEHVVQVSGKLSEADLRKMNRPWAWQGRDLPAAKVSWQSDAHLRIALKTPPPGLIDTMCAQFGLTVISNKRIRIGRVSMGRLPSGNWRYLLSHERF